MTWAELSPEVRAFVIKHLERSAEELHEGAMKYHQLANTMTRNALAFEAAAWTLEHQQ